MELDVCHASLLVKQHERMMEELRTQLSEERGKRRREREKGRSRKVGWEEGNEVGTKWKPRKVLTG